VGKYRIALSSVYYVRFMEVSLDSVKAVFWRSVLSDIVTRIYRCSSDVGFSKCFSGLYCTIDTVASCTLQLFVGIHVELDLQHNWLRLLSVNKIGQRKMMDFAENECNRASQSASCYLAGAGQMIVRIMYML
jgi:hypothetical protein